MSRSIQDSADRFLAHALAQVEASLEHYLLLADTLALHHNHEVARLFRQLAELLQEQSRLLQRLCRERDLPRLAPWEYRWHCSQAPGQNCLQQVRYLISRHQALQLAIDNEQQARNYYLSQADGTDPEIRWLAGVLTASQEVILERLSLWLEMLDPAHHDAAPDTDPPNIPG